MLKKVWKALRCKLTAFFATICRKHLVCEMSESLKRHSPVICSENFSLLRIRTVSGHCSVMPMKNLLRFYGVFSFPKKIGSSSLQKLFQKSVRCCLSFALSIPCTVADLPVFVWFFTATRIKQSSLYVGETLSDASRPSQPCCANLYCKSGSPDTSLSPAPRVLLTSLALGPTSTQASLYLWSCSG